MSIAYIPTDAYAVCTNQMNTDPKKLIPTRSVITTVTKQKLILLTVEDKNTNEKFECKAKKRKWMAIAGLIVGVILATNPIGWAVLGVCAVILVAAYAITLVIHDCTEDLKAGQWINAKYNVQIDGYFAITENSMLMCGKGGAIQPIISADVAAKAANAVAHENMKEIAAITLTAVGNGFLVGKMGYLNFGKSMLTTKGIGFTVSGLAATLAMTTFQSHLMRNNGNYSNNDVYQRMNEYDDTNWSDPDETNREFTEYYMQPENMTPPPTIATLIGLIDMYNTGKLVGQDAALLQQLQKLSRLPRHQLRRSTVAANVLEKIQANKYPTLIERMNNANLLEGNQNILERSKINKTFLNNASNTLAEGRKSDMYSLDNPNSILSKGAGVALFFAPLISNYFSENARRKLAEYAVQDDTSGVAVRACGS